MIPITDAILVRVGEHEGFRPYPYWDCCGRLLRTRHESHFGPSDHPGKLTIGYGWNLEDVPISEDLAREAQHDKLDDVRAELEKRLPWLNALDPLRQEVILDLGYNLGVSGLIKHNPRFLAAMQLGDWELARGELLGGEYERDTGERARRNGRMIETGVRET